MKLNWHCTLHILGGKCKHIGVASIICKVPQIDHKIHFIIDNLKIEFVFNLYNDLNHLFLFVWSALSLIVSKTILIA